MQRAAYELYVSRERLPRGTKVYAKCGNRLCVNHKHLFLSYSPFKSVEALAAGGRLR